MGQENSSEQQQQQPPGAAPQSDAVQQQRSAKQAAAATSGSKSLLQGSAKNKEEKSVLFKNGKSKKKNSNKMDENKAAAVVEQVDSLSQSVTSVSRDSSVTFKYPSPAVASQDTLPQQERVVEEPARPAREERLGFKSNQSGGASTGSDSQNVSVDADFLTPPTSPPHKQRPPTPISPLDTATVADAPPAPPQRDIDTKGVSASATLLPSDCIAPQDRTESEPTSVVPNNYPEPTKIVPSYHPKPVEFAPNYHTDPRVAASPPSEPLTPALDQSKDSTQEQNKANDTFDDLADIINRLSIQTSEPADANPGSAPPEVNKTPLVDHLSQSERPLDEKAAVGVLLSRNQLLVGDVEDSDPEISFGPKISGTVADDTDQNKTEEFDPAAAAALELKISDVSNAQPEVVDFLHEDEKHALIDLMPAAAAVTEKRESDNSLNSPSLSSELLGGDLFESSVLARTHAQYLASHLLDPPLFDPLPVKSEDHVDSLTNKDQLPKEDLNIRETQSNIQEHPNTESATLLNNEVLVTAEFAPEVSDQPQLPVDTAASKLERKMADNGSNSPPLSKGAYNIDWDNFDDSMNPFQTKSKVIDDTPIGNGPGDDDEGDDPFKPKKSFAKSPPKKKTAAKTGAKSKVKSPPQKMTAKKTSPVKAAEDPVAPASDVVERYDDPVASNSGDTFEDALENNIDPFKSSRGLANSPTVGENVDPFTSSRGLANSPLPGNENIDPFKSSRGLANSPPTVDENIDPFKSSRGLANSPPPAEVDENIDPFKSSRGVANSPPPTIADDINPFKSSAHVANTPPPADDIDPFKSTRALANSPAIDTNIDPFKSMRALSNSPALDVDIDPFKSGSKAMANSPPVGRKSFAANAGDDVSAMVVDTAGAPPPVVAANETNNNDVQSKLSKPKSSIAKKKSASNLAKRSPKKNTPSKTTPSEPLEVNAAELKSPPKNRHSLDGGGEDEEFTLATLAPPDHIQQQYGMPDEEFTNAADVFNNPSAWEMLEKSGNTADFKESALARQSLYRKFDPLVKGAPSPVVQKIAKPRAPQIESLPESDDLLLMSTPPTSKERTSHPAARTLAERINDSEATTHGQNGEVDKILACSPQAADSGNSTADQKRSAAKSNENSATDIVEVLKYSQADVDRMRKELDFELKGRFLAKERTYLQSEQKLKDERADLVSQMDKSKVMLDDMKKIVSEYEVTMNQLIESGMDVAPSAAAAVLAEKDNVTSTSKESLTDVIKERDQALEDIRSVETAFADLHRRYEKTKQTVEGFKKNEETLKKCVTDYQQKLKKQEERYQALKAHAEEKLELANDEIDKMRKTQEAEIARLQAAVKRFEVKCNSQEHTIEQREKENQELTAICDELISKVGVH